MTPSYHPAPPPAFDPGLTQQYTGALVRAINKDGSFNVNRKGLRGAAGSAYIHLVRISWSKFLFIFGLAYLLVNCLFAGIYLELGRGALHASERDLGLVSL